MAANARNNVHHLPKQNRSLSKREITNAFKGVEWSARPIVTEYYADLQGKELIRTLRSKHAATAVTNAMMHMQLDHYGALLVVIYDGDTTEHHCTMRWERNRSEIRTLFKRDPKDYPVSVDR